MDVHNQYPDEKYEGTEKLLEIWFFYEKDSFQSKTPNLMKMSRPQIKHILDIAHCEIVKEMHNECQLSYVLSESSLFITENRLILKTCGSTLLLNTLDYLTQVSQELGFSKHVLYYSRRSFLYPELQSAPHSDFKSEIKYLDNICESGFGYIFGHVNSHCWHLYCGQSNAQDVKEPAGQTIEVIMHDLNLQKMKLFYADNVISSEEATQKSGIADLFPKSCISSYLFKPCGYSVNGLMKKDEYFTIHVTPEPDFSYASFETNANLASYSPLIARVLDIFEPGSFICTFIAEMYAPTYVAHTELEKMTGLHGYKRSNLHTVMDCGRKLTFAEFSHH